MNLSDNFTLAELVASQTAHRFGIDNTPPDDVVENLRALCVNVLQPLRERLGAPIVISSGYRCPALNEKIGGARASQHTRGQAADIIVTGRSPVEVAGYIAESDLPFDQVIYEGTWTHVSYSAERRGSILTAKFSGGRASYLEGIVA